MKYNDNSFLSCNFVASTREGIVNKQKKNNFVAEHETFYMLMANSISEYDAKISGRKNFFYLKCVSLKKTVSH